MEQQFNATAADEVAASGHEEAANPDRFEEKLMATVKDLPLPEEAKILIINYIYSAYLLEAKFGITEKQVYNLIGNPL